MQNISGEFITKKIKQFTSFIFAVFSFFLFATLANAQSVPYVTITAPNGGEYLTAGQYTPITWQSNSTGYCYLTYVTAENPYMQNFIANTQAESGVFYWQVTKPSATNFQPEKIQINCDGGISDSSDNYFYVMNPQPVCDKKAQVAFTDTSTPSIFRGGVVNNEVAVTNPNDSACGTRQYGLTRSYPGGWTMDLQLSVNVPAGSTVKVPMSLTSSDTAEYKTYPYQVYAGDSSGGTLVGATNYVTVVPKCDATVQASLSSSLNNLYPGQTLSNSLLLTNPNPAECTSKNYVYSRSYPGGWSMDIQPNVNIASGETVSVPFGLTASSSAAVGSYNYKFWAYSAVSDGSGQTQVGGVVNVLDNVAPSVAITMPANNTLIPKRSLIGIFADASDNVGVIKAEFYVNGALTCSYSPAEYGCTFTTENRKGVKYTLTVKAYDEAGNVGTATSVVTTK